MLDGARRGGGEKGGRVDGGGEEERGVSGVYGVGSAVEEGFGVIVIGIASPVISVVMALS